MDTWRKNLLYDDTGGNVDDGETIGGSWCMVQGL